MKEAFVVEEEGEEAEKEDEEVRGKIECYTNALLMIDIICAG